MNPSHDAATPHPTRDDAISEHGGACPPADVSVVVACYTERRLDSIRAALRSLTAQTLTPREVIVAVDNNANLATLIADEFPDATVVVNEGCRGASATRNAGARWAATSMIAFLDDDEHAEPTWLAQLIRPFSEPGVVGTGGKYVPAWSGRKPTWFPDEFAWTVGGSYRGMPERTERVRNVWSGNMAVRRVAFDGVSGFRTRFGKQGAASQPEDTDLCIRVAAHTGGHWMYVPDAVIHHDVPPSRASAAFFIARCYSEGAGKAVMRQHLGSDAVTDEHAFVRRAMTTAIGRLASASTSDISQALMMMVGIASAALGFVATRMRLISRGGGSVECA